ncbi:MAG: hypothetical protein IKD78_09345, partial [Bacteroidales bacterium]|nr:hypothetical protein [Bacteroidales bacterium]
MQKLKKWVLAATLICGTSVFMACSSNDDDPAPQPDLNLAEKIVGKWMTAELDGKACPTNLKAVVTFDSPTKATGSLSDFSKAIDMAPSIKPHRHTYIHEEKYRELAKALLTSDGKLKAV